MEIVSLDREGLRPTRNVLRASRCVLGSGFGLGFLRHFDMVGSSRIISLRIAIALLTSMRVAYNIAPLR